MGQVRCSGCGESFELNKVLSEDMDKAVMPDSEYVRCQSCGGWREDPIWRKYVLVRDGGELE